MKKFFALVLAVVMVLAVTSSAMAAFTWNAGSSDTADTFANRYKIEVVKLANETGIIGTNKLIEAPGATAVNNASVYFYIRLTVTGAAAVPTDPAEAGDRDAVQMNAKADVTFTALNNVKTTNAFVNQTKVELKDLQNGVYYLDGAQAASNDGKLVFKLITGSLTNSDFSAAAFEGRVLDTATAKVYAKVYSKRPLDVEFQSSGYFIKVLSNGNVRFANKAETATPTNIVEFVRNSSSKQVTDVKVIIQESDGNFVDNLYTFLGFRAPDVTAGRIYMTDDNLRAAFGFDFKGESSITWNANSTAIILDPAIGVGIPKTGDNASVIGFAMVMIAVIGAAVAVKKVKA